MANLLKDIESKISGATDPAVANQWLQTRGNLLTQEATKSQTRLRTALGYLAAIIVAAVILMLAIKRIFLT